MQRDRWLTSVLYRQEEIWDKGDKSIDPENSDKKDESNPNDSDPSDDKKQEKALI